MLIEDFEKHLHVTRKKNGEKIMESSIERYIQFISRYFDRLQKCDDMHECVDNMNMFLNQRKSPILYSAFMHYLNFRGVDTDERVGIHNKLKPVKKHANAFNSVKFLQEKVLSKREIKVLLEKEEDVFLRCLYNFMYDTACRRSEAIGLKFKNIRLLNPKNPDEAQIIKDGVYGHVVLLGKGGKKRTVVIGKQTFKLLLELYGTTWKLEDNVFVFYKNPINKTLYKDQQNMLYRSLQKSSLTLFDRNVNPHSLRHTRATHLAENGMPPNKLQLYLGHADINVTMVYIHLSDKSGVDAMREFGGFEKE